MNIQFYSPLSSYFSARGSYIIIWVRSRRCSCLVTWFCYQLIAKPGNKTAAPSWPDPYAVGFIYPGKARFSFTYYWEVLRCVQIIEDIMMVVFVCLHIQQYHYHPCEDVSESIELLKCLPSTVCVLLSVSKNKSIFSIVVMHLMEQCVFS